MTALDEGWSELPLARTDLDINEVDDGLVIYDVVTDRVHYLNLTASVVFVECTGENDEAAIAGALKEIFGLQELPTAETKECLSSLWTQGLLVGGS
ncbi:MAG TPA: hypothetical protein VHV57_16915 [Acidimicrobiales bacterium]|jgi:hypothetical protein|nr:hypothetical protein [Acidimicrobiales bacterium]